MPAVEQIEKDYAGRLKIAKVNAAENRMLCARLRVMSLPTFILYQDGAEHSRIVGENTTGTDLRAAVETMLAKDVVN
jgi:thioredoxin 1